MDLCWTCKFTVKSGFTSGVAAIKGIWHLSNQLWWVMAFYDGRLYEYDNPYLNVSKLEVPTIVFWVFFFFFVSLIVQFLFCFLSHDSPLSGASFHLSISALYALSAHNKSYFKPNKRCWTNIFDGGSFSGVTEWRDWSLLDQWSVLNNVQKANISPENMGILFKPPSEYLSDTFFIIVKVFLFPRLPLPFWYKWAYHSWPNKAKWLTVYYKRFF